MSVLPERIEGDGVLLRRWRVEDAAALGRALQESDDHLRPWMAFMADEPLTPEQHREMLRERELEWSQGGDVMLAIMVDEAIAGSCGLHRRRGAKTLELGYWIHPSFTRRGLATAVARLLTDVAFSVPDIDCVEIHHDRANAASSGIPRKLGFRLIDETPDDGKALSAIGIDCTWRMERDDWLRASTQAEGPR